MPNDGLFTIKNLLGTGQNGKSIKTFAKSFDLVYFGHVDHRYDDHAVVRGVTASSQHTDRHFAVGTIKNHDVSVLERTNTLHFPSKGATDYRWVIVQVDLKEVSELPHIFIDAHHYDEIFYSNLLVNFPNFQNAHEQFASDAAFTHRFKLYAPPDKLDEVSSIMTPGITGMLAHHFANLDYEFDDDTLYIYSPNQQVTEKEIERMVRVGLWLAEQCEHRARTLRGEESA